MRYDLIKPGLYIKTIDVVKRWHQLIVSKKAIQARKANVTGVVWKAIPKHFGAWWVRQFDGSIAAYWYYELTPTTAPSPVEESEFEFLED